MEPKLKLVVLGANGRTGKLGIEAALEKGMDVTAAVRSANKKPSRSHNRLEYVIGDPCDPRFLSGIMQNQDVVISTLGVGSRRGLQHPSITARPTRSSKQQWIRRKNGCL